MNSFKRSIFDYVDAYVRYFLFLEHSRHAKTIVFEYVSIIYMLLRSFIPPKTVSDLVDD